MSDRKRAHSIKMRAQFGEITESDLAKEFAACRAAERERVIEVILPDPSQVHPDALGTVLLIVQNIRAMT